MERDNINALKKSLQLATVNSYKIWIYISDKVGF